MASHRSTAYAYREAEPSRLPRQGSAFASDWLPVIATLLLAAALVIMLIPRVV